MRASGLFVGAVLAALAGCRGVAPPSGTTAAPEVPVRVVATVDLDSVLPTDLLIRPDGEVFVLDGYGGRILRFDADGSPGGAWASTGIGRPVRLAQAGDGGTWAAVPGLDDDPGLLVHLDTNGAVDRAVAPATAAGVALHPVDVVDRGARLLVADRSGGLSWVDATTGLATSSLTEDAEHRPLRRVVDLAEGAGGEIVAVDTLAPRIVRLSVEDPGGPGENLASFGRAGLGVGQLARPTAAAVTAGGAILVSDSVLGVVQAFEADGDVIGVFTVDGEPLHFGHPTAVRASGSFVAVLEASPARLLLLALDAPLPPAPPPSLLRTTLVDAEAEPGGAGGQSCLQCHDGLVLDGREVWDPARTHHPVDVVPKGTIPDLFPLDDEGKLTCASCHSPHGVVDSAASDLPVAQRVRHQSAASPFERLDTEADALCVACHEGNPHVGKGSSPLASSSGHPTGAALVAALAKRGQGSGPTDPTLASCQSCHAMHGATGAHITRDPGDGATCLGCHPAMAKSTSNHPLGRVPGADLLAEVAAGVHRGQHLALAADGGIGCLTCHDLQGSVANDLVRSLPGGAPACLDCHAVRADLQGGPHAHLEKAGKPTCVACHDVHGGERSVHLLAEKGGTPGDPAGCLSCHGPRGKAAPAGNAPGRAGHPSDGRALASGGALTCLTCHDPHAADLPGSDTCVGCHAEQGTDAAHGGHGSATCLDCHPAHHEPAVTSRDVNPASARCLACHAPEARTAGAPKLTEWEHPASTFRADGDRWASLAGLTLFDARGEPVPAARNGELTCQTCHLVHGPSAAGDDNLRRSGGWQAACASCHGEDALVLYRYFHSPERRKDVRGVAP